MKKSGLFLVLVLTLTTTLARTPKRMMAYSTYRKPFMTVDGFYTPFFLGRNMATMSLEKSYTEKFSHEYSYSTGMNLGFFLNENISIQTGSWVSARNYLAEIDGTFTGASGRITSRYMLNYVSIPLNLKVIIRESVSPFFKVGAVADMLMGFKTQSNFYGSATFDDMALLTKTETQFEKMRYSLLLSFGIAVGDTRKNSMSIQLEPMFLYSLSKDSEVLSSSYKPFYYGLSLTMGYTLTRKEREGNYEVPDGVEF